MSHDVRNEDSGAGRGHAGARRRAGRRRRPSGTCRAPIRPTIRICENLAAFAKDVSRRDRRQAADHGSCRRLAVQGAGDQARGRDRPGADRRGADLDARERRPDLRHRRGAVPRDELPEAKKLWQASKPAIEKKLAAQGMMVLFAVPWPPQGIYAKKEHQQRRGHEGPEVARLQCRHRAHRRAGRRAAGDHPGRRTAAGAGHRRGQCVHDRRARPATTARSGRR